MYSYYFLICNILTYTSFSKPFFINVVPETEATNFSAKWLFSKISQNLLENICA